MISKIRAALIGFAHMHVNEIAQYIIEHPDYELVCGADLYNTGSELSPARYTDAWNREHVSKTYEIPIYDDYTDMLNNEKPDIAFIMCENSRKADVVFECARRGIDISIEKPMAMNLQDALRIRELSDKYGVGIYVNWPIAWRGWLHEMKEILDSGIVGRLIKIYAPAGHTGPLGIGAKHRGVSEKAQEMTDEQRGRTWWYRSSEGGGVFLDMLCYGCMFSCMYTDVKARSVVAHSENLNTGFADIQDNTVAVFNYPSVMSVADATWTTPAAAISPGPVLYCTDGVISCRRQANGDVSVETIDLQGEHLKLPSFSFSESMKNIAWHYAEHKLNGEPMHEMLMLERNIEVMAMIEAAVCSCRSGKQEEIIYG